MQKLRWKKRKKISSLLKTLNFMFQTHTFDFVLYFFFVLFYRKWSRRRGGGATSVFFWSLTTASFYTLNASRKIEDKIKDIGWWYVLYWESIDISRHITVRDFCKKICQKNSLSDRKKLVLLSLIAVQQHWLIVAIKENGSMVCFYWY